MTIALAHACFFLPHHLDWRRKLQHRFSFPALRVKPRRRSELLYKNVKLTRLDTHIASTNNTEASWFLS
jgi:hypothetical protein